MSQDVDGQLVCRLVIYENIENEKERYFRAAVRSCIVSFPKTKRHRQPWAFRINTKHRKLIIDPGTEEDR